MCVCVCVRERLLDIDLADEGQFNAAHIALIFESGILETNCLALVEAGSEKCSSQNHLSRIDVRLVKDEMTCVYIYCTLFVVRMIRIICISKHIYMCV